MIHPRLEQWLEEDLGRAMILRQIKLREWKLTLQYKAGLEITFVEFEESTPDECQFRALEWIA